MVPTKTYNKLALPTSELLNHLRNKGLYVSDQATARRALETIGYYRLLIYMRPLQDNNKKFLASTNFENVMSLYEFDRKLRLLCMDAIERIEVTLRASLVNNLAVPYGAHFYDGAQHYTNSKGLTNFKDHVKNARYLGIDHYRNTYMQPANPPIWVLLEAVTFGAISTLFADLNLNNRKQVSKIFGFDETILVSWFRTLTVLRNMCAHHNRVWNFRFVVNQPKLAKSLSSVFNKQDSFHARAVVLAALLKNTDSSSDWTSRLKDLLTSAPPQAHPTALGFPSNWESDPFWK